MGLTGTPFRSDANPIPFVTYARDADGTRRSASDYVYGYGPALGDGVVRPVIFLAYSGEMRWRTRAGDEITGTLGAPMTADQLAQAWRTALDPEGEWVARVLDAADRRLTEVRRGMPDAAGLVIASDHDDARAYAALLRRVTGTRPVVVLSDDPAASKKIAAFAASDDRWMVAVRMVSEGVDIPRLAVGVFATSVSTALFFAQAVGRFVRARRRGETASVFLPSVPVLLGYAAELEAERDHVLRLPGDDDPERELAEAQRRRDTPDELGEAPFTALRRVGPLRPGALRRGRVRRVSRGRGLPRPARAARAGAGGAAAAQAPGGAAEENDHRPITHRRRPSWPRRGEAGRAGSGRPLRPRRAAGRPGPGRLAPVTAAPAPVPAAPVRQTLAGLRKELNGLIAAWHHRTGQPHGTIHAELRRACGGPPLAEATADQIQARIAMLRRWASCGR